ncbi:hypothetical protein [Ulvibacterium sp.]|uniref:hypothetical protein n=1 Tax=Ulvibacterium sp. TaxID=2665914 RepID=UPI00262EA0C6|nr:hypothetical protein [Ulvibacterium sp.]
MERRKCAFEDFFLDTKQTPTYVKEGRSSNKLWYFAKCFEVNVYISQIDSVRVVMLE